MKKTGVLIALFIIGYFLISQFIFIEIDPCDIKCDNCMNAEQCEICYDDCYKQEMNN
jgi:hypothetical protein